MKLAPGIFMAAAPELNPSEDLRAQAQVVRDSGVLGKPGSVTRLFDFLLERTLLGRSPKELEIAVEVFGKETSFDVSQDSMVRVYVHKLRRRLENFYARAGSPVDRIVIPKGQYRLALERGFIDQTPTPVLAPVEAPEPEVVPIANLLPDSAPEPAVGARHSWRTGRWRTWLLAGAGALIASVIGAVITLAIVGNTASDREARAVRKSSVWAPLLADDLPITIVVGDYYMVGETDGGDGIKRLVREFFINSPGDLLHQVEVNPEGMQRYRDLSLTYLPTATAFALEDVASVLAAKRKSVRVRLMSELDGATLKHSHIVYIGYVSGMAMLGDAVFAGSRLSPGGSYDELLDSTANKSYTSTAGADSTEMRYTDYGYFSTFPGPGGGNRIVVIAGTRDMGVMQMAEAITQPTELDAIAHAAGSASGYESLYEVYGVGKANVKAKQLFVSELKTARIWDAN
jgi:hypothetical protein